MPPRTLAHTIIALAVAAMLTMVWLVAAGGRVVAWVLGVELFAIVVAGLLLSAELRPGQRHRVK